MSKRKAKKVVSLRPWVTVEFPHFVGVRHRNGPWETVFLKGTNIKIDCQKLGARVELHENGIEFLEGP